MIQALLPGFADDVEDQYQGGSVEEIKVQPSDRVKSADTVQPQQNADSLLRGFGAYV
jgi:hypothetical protein